MIAKLAGTLNLGAGAFEAALKTLVLDPLRMSRTRSSRSLATAQLSGEARYHIRKLGLARSIRQEEQPWVTAQYGGWNMENFDGCGGISAAVVDIARMGAMLSVRQNNPVLNADSIDAMLANAAEATSNLSGSDAHGYHGWDWVDAVDVANNIYSGSKGGSLYGNQTTLRFTTGGFSYAFGYNGNRNKDIQTGWYDPVRAPAEAHDWKGVNLFPTYGMPAFTQVGRVRPVVRTVRERKSMDATMQMVEMSMVPKVPLVGPRIIEPQQ